MSNVYQEKPNIVEVTMKDKTGTAVRFVVGKTLDEVIAIIEPEAPTAGRAMPKTRKRRTRAEMAAAEAPVYEPEAPTTEVPPPHRASKEKAWA